MADEDKRKSDDCIQVVVRCRPQNRKEKEEARQNIIDIDVERRSVQINKPGDEAGVKSYTFDGAYDENTQQKAFYEDCCFNLVENVLEGFNATVFAYGQTGCGKSYTMQGPANAGPEGRGVIPNAFVHVFDAVKASTEVQYLIHCSYLEIYNEEIRDLLVSPKDKNPPKCDVKEDPGKGVFVKNLIKKAVKSELELQSVFDSGVSNRTVASTNMNDESSRSHSIFTIVIEMSMTDKDTGKESIKVGKLNLVDLAGSERQKKTGASGAVLKEGAKINLSLSALGNVISALSEAKAGKHIPYRDSKLTRLLQDSLGGNTKTLMVAAISPADYNWEETSSTLRYANRAKNIQNKPKINEDPKDTMMRELKEQVENLKKLLEQAAAGGGTGAAIIAQQPPSSVSASIDSNNSIANEAFLREKQEMERALAAERAKHEELMNRMLELQMQFTGSKSGNYENEMRALDQNSGVSSSAIQASAQEPQMSQEQLQQQSEAAQRLKERRKASKVKRETQKKRELELARLAAAAAEEEMEELREKVQGKVQEQSTELQQAQEESRRKLVKLKRKYEKKLQASRAEIDDVLEEASYQRSQLMESVREAEKNRALFEAICMSVMTQRDLQQLMDRARYDEDEEYWIIPYVKLANSDVPMVQRSMEYGSAVGGGQYGYSNESAPQFQQQLHSSYSEISPRGQPQRSSASSAHHSAGANAAFPGLSGNSAASSRRNSRENDTSMRKAHSGGRNAYAADTGDSDNYNYHNDQNYEDGTTNFGKGGGGMDMSSCGVLPSQLNQNNNVASLPAVGKGARNASAGVMPLLGAGAARASDAQQNDYEYYCGDGQDTAGPPKKKLSAEEKAKRKAKKAKKMEKEAKRLAQAQQNGPDAVYSDEAGAGESAGVTTEWGWANEMDERGGIKMARDDNDSEPAYSDDEDFADDSDVAPTKKGGPVSVPLRGGNENFPNAHPPSDMNSKSANTKAPKRKGGGGTALPAL